MEMSKEEIIKRIVKETDCTEEKAESIFQEAIDNNDIIITLDWEYIINRVIIFAMIMMAFWALWKHIG